MQVQDMTIGKPLKLILTFAIPIFIGNIFQQIYSIVDTIVVGYTLGDNAISAIGATASLYSLLINAAIGVNSGFSILITQAFGAHDSKRLKQSIAGTIVLNTGITFLLTLLSLAFMRPLLYFLNTPESIFTDSYHYIFILCAGLLATTYYNMFAGILRAVGNSRTPLYFLILGSVLNIALDLLLVAVFPLGIAGAAYATVISQLITAILCGFYMFRKYRNLLPDKADFQIPKSLLTGLLSTGLAMALMYCVVDLGSVIFQRAANALGEMYITAHTAARRLILIMMMPGQTIALANSTFVGQNWGADKPDRIQSAIKQISIAEIFCGLFSCSLLWVFGEFLVRFTTGTENIDIIQNAILSMRIHGLFYPALGILVCLRTSMQAMGYKTAPILSSIIELVMKILFAVWLIPHFGFIATCFTEPIIWVIMMMYLLISYLKLQKNWKKNRAV